ncbi:hypothetical protein, partial [Pseudomonas syringae]|uniref:hypothetical protein n=1 Tax=Pseudomonas syringae TaxID=317 RepID=UPI001C11E6B9
DSGFSCWPRISQQSLSEQHCVQGRPFLQPQRYTNELRLSRSVEQPPLEGDFICSGVKHA